VKFGIVGAVVWDRLWYFTRLPPFGNQTELHLDLASAAIALLALAFSIYTWRHQKKMRRLSIAAQRDAGLTKWIELAIDAIVEMEFLLRGWSPGTPDADAVRYSRDRDDRLAKLAAVIDKGRLYFPRFTRDIVEIEGVPAADLVQPKHNVPVIKGELPLLDDLVEIYDLARKVDFQNGDALKKTRTDVMKKKRHFVETAQNEVEFRRQPSFIE
jgi:hypothetical protein